MFIYRVEIRRRKVSDESVLPIRDSGQIYEYLMKYCFKAKDLWREQCYAVFLDNGGRPLGHLLLSAGGLEITCIDGRLVAETALRLGARKVILSHNHPSGNCKPSQYDISQTEKIKKLLDVVDVRLLDHIVISDEEFFSFADGVKHIVKDV